MRTVFRVATALLVWMMGAISLPAAASEGAAVMEGMQPAVMVTEARPDYTVPVAFKSGLGHMTVEEMVAIAIGAGIVGSAADMYLGGGALTVLGAIVGAALGSEWYERHMWPF